MQTSVKKGGAGNDNVNSRFYNAAYIISVYSPVNGDKIRKAVLFTQLYQLGNFIQTGFYQLLPAECLSLLFFPSRECAELNGDSE